MRSRRWAVLRKKIGQEYKTNVGPGSRQAMAGDKRWVAGVELAEPASPRAGLGPGASTSGRRPQPPTLSAAMV